MAEGTEVDRFETVQEIIIDFGNICRFCLTETNNTVSIHDECLIGDVRSEREETIATFVTRMTFIKMDNAESFPSLVCENCCDVIRMCYEFKQTICQSDLSLRDCYTKTLEQTKSEMGAHSPVTTFITPGTDDENECVSIKEEAVGEDDENIGNSDGCFNDLSVQSDVSMLNNDDKREGSKKRFNTSNLTQSKVKELSIIKADNIKQKYQKMNTLSERLKEAQTKLAEDILRSRDLMLNKTQKLVVNTSVFPCPQCSLVFPDVDALRQHEKLNHKTSTTKSQFECQICHKEFYLRFMLTRHYRNVHKTEVPSLPDVIVADAPQKEDNEKKTKRFRCYHCIPIKGFDRKEQLLRHLKSVHGKTMSPKKTNQDKQDAEVFKFYACARCETEPTFATKFSLNRHLMNVHKLDRKDITAKDMKSIGMKKEDVETSEKKEDNDSSKNMKLFKLYVCTDCSPPLSFSAVTLFINHKTRFHNKLLEDISLKELSPVYVDSFNVFEKGDEYYTSRIFKVLCKNCKPPVEFKSAKDFVIHMNSIHPTMPNENWDINSRDLMECDDFKELNEPKQVVRNWKCSECSASYIRKHSLHTHMKEKHNKVVKIGSISCPEPYCEESFFTNRQVIQHGITAHEKYYASLHNVFKEKILHSPTEADSRPRNFECDICQKRYVSKTSLKRHILKTHLGGLESENAVCSYCGKVLSNKLSLKSHIEFVHEAVFVSCPVCKKNINFKTIGKHYKVHQAETRMLPEIKNKYLCNLCGRILKSKTSFEDHQKLHNNVRDHICETCGSGYTNKKNLYIHKKVHEGSNRKVFQCDQCEKVFSGKHTLNRHLLTHSGKKNFICEICSKCFYTIQELKRHVRYHKKEYRFDCQLCNMRFLDKSRFRHHMMRHRNIRPHKCHFCDKVFIVRRKMNLHMAARHNVEVHSTKSIWKDPKTYVPLDALL